MTTTHPHITVDLHQTTSPMRHIAAGNLHLFDARTPAGWLSDGITVNAVRGQAHSRKDGYADYEYLPGFFDEATYRRLHEAYPHAMLMIGVYYGFKNRLGNAWKDVADDKQLAARFTEHIHALMQEAKDRGIAVTSWIPMNEPDAQWNAEDWSLERPERFYEIAFRAVKSFDSNALVQGPEFSTLRTLPDNPAMDKMKDFLRYCQRHDCMPDILSWHDLSNKPPKLEQDITAVNAYISDEFGAKTPPIAITEYQGIGYKTDADGRKAEGDYNTGLATHYIAAMERAYDQGLIAGLRSEWGLTGDQPKSSGDMGEMVDFETKSMPTGLWYVYRFYGQMSGGLASVTKVDTPEVLDAVASVSDDNHHREARMLIGNSGDSDMRVDLNISNLPVSWATDGKVRAYVDAIPETLATPLRHTVQVLDRMCTIDVNSEEGRRLTLPLTVPARTSLAVTLTPPTSGTTTIHAVSLKPSVAEHVTCQIKRMGETAYVELLGARPASHVDKSGQRTYRETGDAIAYTLDISHSDLYELSSTLITSPDGGLFAVYLDGIQMGFPVDLNDNETKVVVFQHGQAYLSQGEHDLSFRPVSQYGNATHDDNMRDNGNRSGTALRTVDFRIVSLG
ncbi:hypothetical protein [Bifidobacterium sp. ESL0704]|uniref:hypothetical protein n=1 Tax=Bifidobacterium sp. ESL0704 TaxID=2983219 RepID=UPI0023F7A666|nr:hypothetical protein [Bifidobacterium sp. ESL0704]WEV52294.1 hypothetical protein OZX64_05135 [Bifidobacterium sp. ESL0704]